MALYNISILCINLSRTSFRLYIDVNLKEIERN